VKPMRATPVIVTAVLLLRATLAAPAYAQAPSPAPADAERPAAWAVRVEARGLPNLHRIATGLYRGAQPTAEGFANLAKMGVKTVVNLRSSHSDRPLLRGTRLHYVELPMRPWAVDEADVVAFLGIATDRKRQPVFFHCQHGADRTGTMAAVWRMTVQRWSLDDALREMKDGGFGYHSIWRNLPDLLQKLDIDKIRIDAGLAPASP